MAGAREFFLKNVVLEVMVREKSYHLKEKKVKMHSHPIRSFSSAKIHMRY